MPKANPSFRLEHYFKLSREDQDQFRENIISKMRPLANSGMSIELMINVVAKELGIAKTVAMICQRSTPEIRKIAEFKKRDSRSIKNPEKRGIDVSTDTGT